MIEVDTPASAMLVLNDVWHPWWSATLDGQPAEILKANVLFRAVAVPAGKHTVRFTFNPLQRRAGAALGQSQRAVALKPLNTMSGALVLCRDGASRPAQSSATLARVKLITGARCHAASFLARASRCRRRRSCLR